MKNKSILLILGILFVCFAGTIFSAVSNTYKARSSKNSEIARKKSENKIVINVDGKRFIVDMYDNPTANDLLSQLPLTLKANNYAGYDEKVIRLKTSLSMEKAPKGDDPELLELGYYEPGQWLALYYGYIGYWSEKVPLGKINASIKELNSISDNSSVVIELLKE